MNCSSISQQPQALVVYIIYIVINSIMQLFRTDRVETLGSAGNLKGNGHFLSRLRVMIRYFQLNTLDTLPFSC